jgi:hypothetical protein
MSTGKMHFIPKNEQFISLCEQFIPRGAGSREEDRGRDAGSRV